MIFKNILPFTHSTELLLLKSFPTALKQKKKLEKYMHYLLVILANQEATEQSTRLQTLAIQAIGFCNQHLIHVSMSMLQGTAKIILKQWVDEWNKLKYKGE